MIENLNLTPFSAVRSLSGLSTDVKPIKNIGMGSTFYEMNTGNTYVFSALNINPITNSGWWRIPISPIAIDEIMESETRVFVTPEQRDMIGDIDALEESATRVFVTPEQRDMIGDIDALEESATRVFVTPEQRDMIGDIDALEESATRVFVTPEQREAIDVFISKITVEAEDEESIEVPSDDAVYLLKVVQDTNTVLYVLVDTSAEILLGTALTDVTVAHTDDNTWTITNADTANAVTATIKQFM